MDATVMDPGQMTARLDLELPIETADGQGGVVRTFSVVGSCWAQIVPGALAEETRADETGFAVSHTIWIRFRTDLKAGMRFRKGARSFVIVGFHDPDERRRYLVCTCREEGR